MNNTTKRFLSWFYLLALTILAVSCVHTRNVVYFRDIESSSVASPKYNLEPVIQKNDELSITITSADPAESNIYNLPGMAVKSSSKEESGSGGGAAAGGSYLVSQEGTITFPILGAIRAEGLTKKQLQEFLINKFLVGKLLVQPTVIIRFLNFRISVLGEVARPTVVSVTSEKISILEALALAGDMTIHAQRDNVVLIREEQGRKIIRRLNLNSQEIFMSEYYYLKSNDIIYVEPGKSKVSSSRPQNLIPTILGALSILVVLIDRAAR